jgi:hypothetical protein
MYASEYTETIIPNNRGNSNLFACPAKDSHPSESYASMGL